MRVLLPVRRPASAAARPAGLPLTLVGVAVAAGLLLRVWHYAQNHTIWYDESVLLWNVLDKSYARLLGPLEFAVAAPPLFLFTLKTLAVLCGDAPLAWRLVPFAASCGTLLLTPPLARRVLPPAAVPLAVVLVALSDSHVWLGCTIKPYAGDCFLATALLLFFAATAEWTPARRLKVLAVAAPVVLGFSYAAAFVLGGLLLALLPAAVRARSLGWWAAAGASTAGTFGAFLLGPIRAQRVPGLVLEWEREFLPWRTPAAVPFWLAEHTASVFQYNLLPAGLVLCPLAVVGAVAAWRAGRRGLAVALATPFPLAALASAAKSYPYGLNRLMHFAAPEAILLGLLGFAAATARLPPRLRAALAGVLLAATAAPTAYHLARPWPRPDSSGLAAFVRGARLPGDRVASDEAGYEYFFRGELLPLDAAAAATPPGGRVWAVMDHYTADQRGAYLGAKLAPGGLRPVARVEFEKATAMLWEKPGGE